MFAVAALVRLRGPQRQQWRSFTACRRACALAAVARNAIRSERLRRSAKAKRSLKQITFAFRLSCTERCFVRRL